MEYMLKTTLVPRFGGKTSCDEIGLPVSATGGVVPCGAVYKRQALPCSTAAKTAYP